MSASDTASPMAWLCFVNADYWLWMFFCHLGWSCGLGATRLEMRHDPCIQFCTAYTYYTDLTSWGTSSRRKVQNREANPVKLWYSDDYMVAVDILKGWQGPRTTSTAYLVARTSLRYAQPCFINNIINYRWDDDSSAAFAMFCSKISQQMQLMRVIRCARLHLTDDKLYDIVL